MLWNSPNFWWAVKDSNLGPAETTKTGVTRTVDISEILARALRRLQLERKREKLERCWEEMPAWVFCTQAGTPLDESRVRKNFAEALEKAKLPGFRVYDLRHTFASLLLAQGTPITYVAAQLGHSRPTTTLQWYAHWLPGGRERFVDGIAGAESAKEEAHGPQAWAPVANQALPMLRKRLIRVVGRQGLEPWTR